MILTLMLIGDISVHVCARTSLRSREGERLQQLLQLSGPLKKAVPVGLTAAGQWQEMPS